MLIGEPVTAATALAAATPVGCVALHTSMPRAAFQAPAADAAAGERLFDDEYQESSERVAVAAPAAHASHVLRPQPGSSAAVLLRQASDSPAPADVSPQVAELEAWLCQARADHHTLAAVAETHAAGAALGPAGEALHALQGSLRALLSHMPGEHELGSSSSEEDASAWGSSEGSSATTRSGGSEASVLSRAASLASSAHRGRWGASQSIVSMVLKREPPAAGAAAAAAPSTATSTASHEHEGFAKISAATGLVAPLQHLQARATGHLCVRVCTAAPRARLAAVRGRDARCDRRCGAGGGRVCGVAGDDDGPRADGSRGRRPEALRAALCPVGCA